MKRRLRNLENQSSEDESGFLPPIPWGADS